ncbi:YcaO-like family protein [Pseudodesulfovibrio sp. zrk46]|uniref:YcaO-like family protein n=1 Tax=Pseudodesulfovibrio sp. zrk46 TaxID=2725288 RepID=UPI001449F8EB|nr:YcaO-like family protein [Pseudodesulfovibrio sp. zrk46]QJB58029.1 YcaO-like family protein [Pseudodesulfovibrio sp. zrk46]
MRYKLQMMNTDFGVGMFAAMPEANLSFNEMIEHLRKHPYDDYMHEFVLQGFKDFRTRKLKKLIQEVMKDNGKSDPVLTAIMFEACICHERQRPLLPLFDGLDPADLLPHTPAIHIRSYLQEDQKLHSSWIELFGNNIFAMEPLPTPEEVTLDQIFSDDDLVLPEVTTAGDARAALEGELPPAKERRPLEETIDHAFRVLDKADAFLGPVMQHKASLSPIARLRHWSVKTRSVNGRMSNSLEGIQTSYGRGLAQANADASCAMEMAERFSSYASFSNKGITGYKNEYPLIQSSYDDLDVEAINPNDIKLEVPYAGQKLNWFEGHAPDGKGGVKPVLIPAQLVFLFCNLDEQNLFSALGSTGLASGNTLAEAKVSALTEVIERDSDATVLFDPERCFRVESDDPEIAPLLEAYKTDGIDVWFLDVTPEIGVPCYKSVVLGAHGDVNKGGGCGLNGKSALLSAMTETAYPFPGPKSSPAPEGLPVRKLEDLPDYSTGSAEGDVMVLEKTLMDNGYQPVYADLTRKDLDIPVTRAIVPGLEIVSDFDHYSRVSPRLFRNYLNMFK